MIGLRSKSTTDVGALRRQLDELEGRVAEIDTTLDELTARREQLEAEQAELNGDLVRRWEIEEQLADVKARIQAAIDSKTRPSMRAAQLQAVLTPVIEREREIERRTEQVAHHEQLLEVCALVQRAGEALAEARRLGRLVPWGSDFDASMRKLDTVVTHWDATIAPQLRQRLSDNRRFIAAVEVER